MNQKKRSIWLSFAMFVLIISMQDALADSESLKAANAELFIPAIYPIENAWNKQEYDFTASANTQAGVITPQSLNSIEPASRGEQITLNYSSATKSSDSEKEWVDKVLQKLPYKNTLKRTWDIVDGDVDLMGVKNLRADAGNRGIMYKTNYIPMVGELEGAHIQADLGKDTELKFESDYVPLVGRIDGLKFKTSVGDGTSVSLRYKTDISW